MRRSHRGRSTLTPQTYLARPPWRYAWPGRRCWASAKGGRRAHRTACGRARQDAHSRDRSAVSKKCACTLHSATPRPDFPPRKMKCADDVYRNAHHSFIHHNPQMEIAPEVWPRGGGGRAGGQNAARPRSGQVWTPMPERPEARVRLRDGHDPGEKSTGTKQWPPLSRSGWPGEGTSGLKREEAGARTHPIYLHPYPLHPNCGRSGRLVQIFRKQDSKF